MVNEAVPRGRRRWVALGTNLLTVTNGQTFSGAPAELPVVAPGMITRLPGVTAVQDTGTVGNIASTNPATSPRSKPAASAYAASLGLPATAGTSVAQGRYLNAATARQPVVVLGAGTAQLMGIDRIRSGKRIWLGGQWFYVRAFSARPPIRRRSTRRCWSASRPPRSTWASTAIRRTIYVRARYPGRVIAVDDLLAAQANPENPNQVNVAWPSDALIAQADAKSALDILFLGLGAVALLVGAIGVANIMVISVLERRTEIGLRRALGATRGHIRTQFLAEAIVLARPAAAPASRSAGRHRRLRPRPGRGRRHPAPGLGRRAGRGGGHRRGGRAAARMRAARMSPTQALMTV